MSRRTDRCRSRASFRWVWFLAAPGWLALGLTGCTVDEGTATVATTTSTSAPPGDDVDLPEVPRVPPDEIRRALDQAVAARDVCALIEAVELGVPEATDGDAVIAAYQALADALEAGERFRPASLADAWVTLREGVGAAVGELRATDGQPDAPSVVAVFTTDAMQAAASRIERWADQPADPQQPDGPVNCPADGT